MGGGNKVAAWGNSDNDGTVTVESQANAPQGFTKTEHEYINLSHTEILQSDKVRDILSRIIHE